MVDEFGVIAAYRDIIYPRYDPGRFVGREWLIQEATRRRDADTPTRLVIVGEPGSGKTALIAYLAEIWNCPRHFIRVDSISGVSGLSSRSFLVSLGRQLYQKYGPRAFPGNAPQRTSVTVGLSGGRAEVVGRLVDEFHALPFLPRAETDVSVRVGVATGESRVIGEQIGRLVDVTQSLDELTLLHVCVLDPLKQLAEALPRERVVILVDALDEAAHHMPPSILSVLPRPQDGDYPANLRWIMTSRPGNHLLDLAPEDLLRLDDEVADHRARTLADCEAYIRRRLGEPPLDQVLSHWPPQALEENVQMLRDRSEGNFLYLHHYFQEVLESAARPGIDPAEAFRQTHMPHGLDGIYRYFVVRKIRERLSDKVQLTLRGIMPDNLEDLLRSIPGVQDVHLIGEEATLIVQSKDRLFSELFRLQRGGIEVTGVQTETGAGADTWTTSYLPILGLLAVARDTLTRRQLVAFSGVAPERVGPVLADLDQFLDTIHGEREDSYRFYHRSFAEYLLDSGRNRDDPLDARRFHDQIVAYYLAEKERWKNVDWMATVESYPFVHLAEHLEEAGRCEELHELFAAETAAGRNAWYEASSSRVSIGVYLEGVRRAWRRAREAWAPGAPDTALSIERQCRYALIISSLNGLSGNFPSALLAALVRKEVWSLKRALAFARQIPDPVSHADSLLELAALLETAERGELAREAQRTAHGIERADERSRTLIRVVSLTEGVDRVTAATEALATIRETWEHDRPDLLGALAAVLPDGELRQQALQVAREIDWPGSRIKGLAALVPCLGTSVLEEAWREAQRIRNSANRAEALVSLASHCRDRRLDEALAAARSILHGGNRAEALGRLVAALAVAGRPAEAVSLLREDWQASSWEERSKAKAVEGLAPHLTANLQIAVLDLVRSWQSPESQSDALRSLAPHLGPEALGRAIEVGREIDFVLKEQYNGHGWSRSGLPRRLAELGQTEEARALLAEISSPSWRLDELVALLPYLSGTSYESVREEAWRATREMKDETSGERDRREKLSALAPHLSPVQLAEAVAFCCSLNDDWPRAKAIIAFAAHLPVTEREDLFRDARKAAETITFDRARAAAIAEIERASCSGASESLAAARQLSDSADRATALAGCLDRLVEPQRSAVLDEVWRAVDETESVWKRFETIMTVTAFLSGTEWAQAAGRALSIINEIDDDDVRGGALTRLAPYLDAADLRAALRQAAQIQDTAGRSLTFAGLAPRLAELGEVEEALDLARHGMSEEWPCLVALVGLVPYLPPPLVDEVLEEALRIDGGWPLRPALAWTAVLASERLAQVGRAQPALDLALQISEAQPRAAALARLAPPLASSAAAHELLMAALIAARQLPVEHRATALLGLALYLGEAEQAGALRDAAMATEQTADPTHRLERLAALSMHLLELPPPVRHSLWCELLEMGSSRPRVDLLADLEALAGLIVSFGADVARGIVHTLSQVGRWWP